MTQPWIHKAKTDTLFILMPPFAILAVVFLCQDFLQDIEAKYSFYTWLFFVVFIDVAHVYATLFKTYLVPEEFQKKKAAFNLAAGNMFLYRTDTFLVWQPCFLGYACLCGSISFYTPAVWIYAALLTP